MGRAGRLQDDSLSNPPLTAAHCAMLSPTRSSSPMNSFHAREQVDEVSPIRHFRPPEMTAPASNQLVTRKERGRVLAQWMGREAH